MGSRWYASEASTTVLADVVPAGRNVLLCLWRCAGRYGTVLVWRADVTGRSDHHIDRLARDWIAHHTSPTAEGGRGVAKPACSCRRDPSTGWTTFSDGSPMELMHADTCARARFDRAEARARRVVRR